MKTTNSTRPRVQKSRSAADEAPISKLAIAVVALAALVIGSFGGSWVSRRLAGTPTASTATAPVTAPRVAKVVSAGPSRFDGMVPVGYLHNEAGAIAAAQSYTAMMTEMLFRPEADSRAAARTMATGTSADAVETVMMTPIAGIRQSLAVAASQNSNGRALVRTVPIGSRTVAYAADKARLDVWSMSLIGLEVQPNSASAGAPTRAAFTTTSFVLEWTSGDWHIASVIRIDDSGPSMSRQAPLNPTAFIDQASVFTPFRYQPNQGGK